MVLYPVDLGVERQRSRRRELQGDDGRKGALVAAPRRSRRIDLDPHPAHRCAPRISKDGLVRYVEDRLGHTAQAPWRRTRAYTLEEPTLECLPISRAEAQADG